jgi:hypothetical protein
VSELFVDFDEPDGVETGVGEGGMVASSTESVAPKDEFRAEFWFGFADDEFSKSSEFAGVVGFGFFGENADALIVLLTAEVGGRADCVVVEHGVDDPVFGLGAGGEGGCSEEALFFAGEGDELEHVGMRLGGKDSGDFRCDRDSTSVIVGTGGGAFFRFDAQVKAVEVSADEDSVRPGSGKGGDDLSAWSGFGDVPPLGEGVVHQVDLEGIVLVELGFEGFASGAEVGREGVSGGESGEKFDGLAEVFGVGDVEGGEDGFEVHGFRLAYLLRSHNLNFSAWN